METFIEIVKYGASISTLLGLSGFIMALIFGVLYKIVTRMPLGDVLPEHVYILLKYMLLVFTIFGVLSISGAIGSILLDKLWIQGVLIPSYIGEARAAIEKEEIGKARIAIQKGLDVTPGHPEFLNLYGQTKYLEKDYEGALSYFTSANAEDQTLKYSYNISSMLVYLERFEEALKKFEEVEKMRPPSSRKKIFKGILYSLNREPEKAKNILLGIVSDKNVKHDIRPLGYFQLGVVGVITDNRLSKQSVNYFLKSVCLDKNFKNVIYGFSDTVPGDRTDNLFFESKKIGGIRETPEFNELVKEINGITNDYEKCISLLS